MNLPEAEWPHSVALWHLTLRELHPLKVGMHLHSVEVALYEVQLEKIKKP